MKIWGKRESPPAEAGDDSAGKTAEDTVSPDDEGLLLRDNDFYVNNLNHGIGIIYAD